ncbi:uncharacterized protein LOC114880869 [Osmia bicornis bicornis]|uniref:uncharacterized protein LOC114880869 n=1 Tax=Osmia bicornis bicornis TaxID=1437191 RepID=UPI0010F6A3D6|nr:uncharacterized protein LOC114880869 [Osmia bicornis bicornis]
MNVNKRPKLPATRCEHQEEPLKDIEKSSFMKQNQAHMLDTLPPEVLEMILRPLPLHDVATCVRLVSRHCSTVAATVLNGAFLAAGTRLETLTKRIEGTLKTVKTNQELLARSKALNALELIRAQYKMLRAVTWRYTHPPTNQQRFPRLCFYAGSLLDNLNELLGRIGKLHSSIVNPRTPDSSMAYFTAACKRFMNFFEKVSERRVNRSALISGCKVVDVLDCLIEGRQVLSFKVMPHKRGTRRTINMKLRYMMKRAWFTCLEVTKNAEENSWRDEQRFMYLRLRRLVGSVNEHLFENLHYEHELTLQIPLILPLRPPPASTYSGYGEYGGQFFYYGNMNKYAYESKFMNAASSANVTVETEQRARGPSSLDLVIEIELKCTSELAPLAVRTVLKSDEFESYEAKTYRNQQMYLRMSITCPASIANRLPGIFVWELRTPRRARQNS